MLILFSSLLLIILALVMLLTEDYPDGIMGKLFMGVACVGAAIVVGSVVEGGYAYNVAPEVGMIVGGLVLDKLRSLRRFFLNRARIRLDEVPKTMGCPALEDVKAELEKVKQDATMFIRRG